MKHKLEPIAYRITIGSASYVLNQVDGEFWEAKRYDSGRLSTCLWTLDEEGDAAQWNTLDEAHVACELHAVFVAAGVDPVVAVLDVQRALRLRKVS